MPEKSKYALSLEELGFRPLADVIGAYCGVLERRQKEIEESFTKGMNPADRQQWDEIRKQPRFSNLGDMTFATDDTGQTWALEKKIDLTPLGFVDMLAYFAGEDSSAPKPH